MRQNPLSFWLFIFLWDFEATQHTLQKSIAICTSFELMHCFPSYSRTKLVTDESESRGTAKC